jgi:sensor c-di-GMP phosphodiesterase-like protein
MSLRRATLAPSRAGLSAFGAILGGLIAFGMIALARWLPRRHRGNPIVEMREALERGEFIPYYQPLIDIRTGRLRGAEVLMRWRKPDGTIVLPGTFIPLAESSGLIFDLTHSLMKQARDEMGSALGRRPHLRLGFNLAAGHLDDEGIVSQIRKIFTGSPIRFSQLIVELTERQPLDDLKKTRQVIAALQSLGVRVAIDDVGAGHSGLSYMLKLGVDIIKIDKAFVDAIGVESNSSTIIETLVDLARNMRMDVVAEGVENFEQVSYLRDIGIGVAQGYVFAPPLPGSLFLQLMAAVDPLVAAGGPVKASDAPAWESTRAAVA